ncbi:FadR/GntR family transcriptional regulator [Rhabdothermincola salaria]|uniref:FadR/GntR family transcriptional regulator n=1 Tax=Rhabdothermincola salaria TaxID=2903142 RepID=UPI001E436D8C|nr:GntR family transcriptional regulator [Rhabdothermincola salaria]
MSARHQLRQPRLAEMVASTLRSRILSGELADGSLLPKQDELLEEFGVSLPPIREALRILETEGLITVQRGNVGGAVVHAPQRGKVVFMMGMVLESRQVPLSDVLSAVIAFEPACAAACAARPDRATTVLPALRATLDAAEAAIDDPTAYAGLARTFHIQIADLCGNEAMSLVVGALESLWTGHVDALARQREEHGAYSDLAARRHSAKEHERLYVKIEKGDVRGAEQLARSHFSEPDPGWERAVETQRTVRAEFLDGR